MATTGDGDEGINDTPKIKTKTHTHIYISIIQTSYYKSIMKTQHLFTHKQQSPGEIKRREVSWTLKKKLAQKRSRGGR